VQFSSRKKREELLTARRKVITNTDIYGQHSNSHLRIFINENLSPHYRNLLYKVKEVAKENDFKFVWVQRGKILVRKNEETRVILKIDSAHDLQKLERSSAH
jgi:hypothetical protein